MEIVLLLLALAVIVFMLLIIQRDSVFTFIDRLTPQSSLIPRQPPLFTFGGSLRSSRTAQDSQPGHVMEADGKGRERLEVSRIMSACAKQIYGYNREQVENAVLGLLEERAKLIRRIEYLEAVVPRTETEVKEMSFSGRTEGGDAFSGRKDE